MKREQIGVNNTINLPVAQDTLNPNLENITSRFINLDSQFRQGSDDPSTDYTLDLSDPLTNVISMRLYSVQIPYSWYVIDYTYGNTCFWVTNKGNTFKLNIEPGNYTPTQFIEMLNNTFEKNGFIKNDLSANPIVSYNINNGLITINLNGYNDPLTNIISSISEDMIFNIDNDSYITFFDFTGQLNCLEKNCTSKNISFNNTLGWLMGYRSPIIPIYDNGNRGVAVLDLYGARYFLLVIDDYNQNHINNGLVSITELSNKLPLPSYYNKSQPYICEEDDNINLITNNLTTNDDNLINILKDKLDIGYGKHPVILPSAPRTLTQAQIYTINEIIKNRQKTTNYKSKAPTTSDIFALIPIKKGGLNIGDIYVEFGSSLQNNKRVYFGPVNIDRMRIRLIDDKGFTVNLHGVDWCFTLISENLYQY
jgi:hypothetical protein